MTLFCKAPLYGNVQERPYINQLMIRYAR